MSSTLKVVGIQSNLVWEHPEANRNYFEKEINELPADVDIVVLPEMFTTGFSMNAKHLAETHEGETYRWLLATSKSANKALIGSLIFTEDEKYYNRLIFIEPNGTIHHYDKRHTFTLAGEHEVFEAGLETIIISYKGWRICPLICYDLRFPVWSRNTHDYDLLIYIASWPVMRVKAWDILLKARAIENMSYVVGVNRIGSDANNYQYSGHSTIIDFMGETVSKIEDNQAGKVSAVLDQIQLQSVRNKLGFLKDRDRFKIL